jgi:hypothetical protein
MVAAVCGSLDPILFIRTIMYPTSFSLVFGICRSNCCAHTGVNNSVLALLCIDASFVRSAPHAHNKGASFVRYSSSQSHSSTLSNCLYKLLVIIMCISTFFFRILNLNFFSNTILFAITLVPQLKLLIKNTKN